MKFAPFFVIPGLLALSFPAFAQVELKHFWAFEDDDLGIDQAGGVNGTLSGMTSIMTGAGHSPASTAAAFPISITGEDDLVTIDGSALFQPGNEAFSMSYWFKMPNDSTTDPRGIFDFSSDGGPGPQSLFIGTTGELAFRIDFLSGGFALAKVSADLEDDRWHFVVATYNPASGLEVHFDGFGTDASTPQTGEVSFHEDSYLGAFNFNGAAQNKGLGGLLDNVAIYSGELDQTQIEGLFEKSLSPLDFLPPSPEENLTITSIEHLDEKNIITWPSVIGATYAIWGTSDLETWFELDDAIAGTGDPVSYDHQFGKTPERYFYRIEIR